MCCHKNSQCFSKTELFSALVSSVSLGDNKPNSGIRPSFLGQRQHPPRSRRRPPIAIGSCLPTSSASLLTRRRSLPRTITRVQRKVCSTLSSRRNGTKAVLQTSASPSASLRRHVRAWLRLRLKPRNRLFYYPTHNASFDKISDKHSQNMMDDNKVTMATPATRTPT